MQRPVAGILTVTIMPTIIKTMYIYIKQCVMTGHTLHAMPKCKSQKSTGPNDSKLPPKRFSPLYDRNMDSDI
jgi:hypothetical protein